MRGPLAVSTGSCTPDHNRLTVTKWQRLVSETLEPLKLRGQDDVGALKFVDGGSVGQFSGRGDGYDLMTKTVGCVSYPVLIARLGSTAHEFCKGRATA